MQIKYICCLLLLVPLQLSALNPSKTYSITPDSLNLDYSTINIKTEDGYKLNSWVYNPTKETDINTVIIIAYGDAGNMSNIVYHAESLVKKGFTVVTFDYRGFGKSSDFEIDPNRLYYQEFSCDLTSVISYVSNSFKNKKKGIWGLSMGTIISSISLSKPEVSIDFYIAEGYVLDINRVVKFIKNIKQKTITLPEEATKYSRVLKNLTIPILIFSGNQDPVTTLTEAKDFIKQKENRQLVEFDGTHLQGFQTLSQQTFGDEYIKEIEGFLQHF